MYIYIYYIYIYLYIYIYIYIHISVFVCEQKNLKYEHFYESPETAELIMNVML